MHNGVAVVAVGIAAVVSMVEAAEEPGHRYHGHRSPGPR